ncbi:MULTISPECIES: NmrA/HSCARG family protein [Amycolatopsis]|uniref:NmrA/HSCARG family protein n=1 Tax=Amycolatopsis albidoflavus TaxID=102226 RepID=A0ABW5IFT6_9PSEU
MTRTLVIGGTGAMGSRVVERLLADTEHEITVLTRDPDSSRAAALSHDRVRLVRGDAGDPRSIESALHDVSQVFCNTDFFSTKSPLAEFAQGTNILEAARQHGVDRFVWSSLDSAATLTNGRVFVPHYEAKAAVAAHIQLHRSEEMMRQEPDGWYTEHVSILVTSPYFENLQSRLSPSAEDAVFTLPLGTGRYPMIALADIAWFAVHMLEHWQSWGARDLSVSADSLTGNEIAETFARVTGTPARYEDLPLDELRTSIPDVGHDYAGMFGFFQQHDVAAHDRDLALLRRLHPGLMTFEDWLHHTGWDGSRREVQQFRPRA